MVTHLKTRHPICAIFIWLRTLFLQVPRKEILALHWKNESKNHALHKLTNFTNHNLFAFIWANCAHLDQFHCLPSHFFFFYPKQPLVFLPPSSLLFNFAFSAPLQIARWPIGNFTLHNWQNIESSQDCCTRTNLYLHKYINFAFLL